MSDWHEWTSCEFYGHKFENGRCVDCGEGDGSDEWDYPGGYSRSDLLFGGNW